MKCFYLCVYLLLAAVPQWLAASEQKFQSIGDLALQSGEILHDVSLGYRMVGEANADRSNVIVFLTWFTGRSSDLLNYGLVGPGRMADTDHYQVVIIDALANGVSSSPSNSKQQPDGDFPAITMADMVDSQHLLLTRYLGLASVHAVIGVSMGGMQTFQWMGQHPEFMTKAVPVDGSPRQTSYDLLQWQVQMDSIRLMQEAGVESSRIARHLELLNLLTLWTPDWFVQNVSAEQLPGMINDAVQNYQRINPWDYAVQLDAMMTLNVFAGDQENTGYVNRVRAQTLVVGVPSDQMVNPAPGKQLAEKLGANYLELESNCGHMGSTCEQEKVGREINAFLR